MAQAQAPHLAAHSTVHVTSTELTRCHTPYSFPIQFLALLQHCLAAELTFQNQRFKFLDKEYKDKTINSKTIVKKIFGTLKK